MTPRKTEHINHRSRLDFNLGTNLSDQGLDVDQRLMQLEEHVKTISNIVVGPSSNTEPLLNASVLNMTSPTREADEETYLTQVAIDKQRSSLLLAYEQYRNNQKSLNKDCEEAIQSRYDKLHVSIGFASKLITDGQNDFGTLGSLERFKSQTKQALASTWRSIADLKYDMQAATITSALLQIAELKEELKKAGEKAA